MDYDILNNIVVTVDYYNHRICTVNWEIEEMVMDFVDITYVISGRAEYIINGTKYTVTAGDLLCIPYGSTVLLPAPGCINGMLFYKRKDS